jgi:biotin operon repressor
LNRERETVKEKVIQLNKKGIEIDKKRKVEKR